MLGAMIAVYFTIIGLIFGASINEGVPAVIWTIVADLRVRRSPSARIGAAIALRSNSASVVQGLFPLVFVILFLSDAFFPANLMLEPAVLGRAVQPAQLHRQRDPRADHRQLVRHDGAEGHRLGDRDWRARLRALRLRHARQVAERPVSWRSSTATIRVLVRRALNEITRVPGAAIPGVLAPTIFFLGLTSVFGSLTLLPGFTTASYQSFLIPVSLLQGAAFTGAATGVNLARDIEQGWFDRLLASPAPRPVLLAGLVLSASLRSLLPATCLFVVAFAVGAHWPGLLGPRDRAHPGHGHGRRGRDLGHLAGLSLPHPVGGAR